MNDIMIKTAARRVALALIVGLTGAAAALPASAQQPSRSAPSAATSPVAAAPVAVAPPAPAVPSEAVPAASTSSTPVDTAVATTDSSSRSLKSLVVPHELSPWSMFMSADIIVKRVMIGLAFASLLTWTICVAKVLEFAMVDRRLRRALDAVTEVRSIAEAREALGSDNSILSVFLATALREARLSAGLSSDDGIKERAASSFAELTRAEARRMRVGMGVLATIGATAPFVGLFGTVWGIMNSFIGISKAQTTNLAVVAPGIAEALLATAIGLVAAIPAVIIYNHFARVSKGYLERVSRASGAAGRLLSRDLDRAHGGALARAAE